MPDLVANEPLTDLSLQIVTIDAHVISMYGATDQMI